MSNLRHRECEIQGIGFGHSVVRAHVTTILVKLIASFARRSRGDIPEPTCMKRREFNPTPQTRLLDRFRISFSARGRRGAAALSWWLAVMASLSSCEVPAQEAPQQSPPDQEKVESQAVAESRQRYNLPWGRGGLNLSAGLRGVYVDNVFLTQTGARDDFILVPECDLAAFFPVGLSNTVTLDLGIAYYQYFNNSSLNSGTPIINPNSEIAFNLQVKDFWFRFSERFSYEESPVYETGGEFFNVYNTGRFARFENQVGVLGTWGLQDLEVNVGYHHQNLFSNGSTYDYIDRASELFSADGMLALSPRLKAGLEAAGSVNRFQSNVTNDCWRARVGPALRLDLSQFIKARAGAGYERIQYDSAAASALGIRPDNTFYAYGGVDHEITRFLSHSLLAFYDNQLAYNSGNLAGTHLRYSLNWRPTRPLSLRPHVEASFYDESYGSGLSTLYHERFTYVLAGLAVRYELGQHWWARLSWDYRLKDSEVPASGYSQNQVALEITYVF